MSTSIGNQAETEAAKHLEALGYKVIDRNWKTRVCEIDIIAQKAKTIYFVEVKYRSSSYQGSGIEYITPKKLEQMKFAAECWVQEKKWRQSYDLAAIEVSGSDFKITNFLLSIL